MASNIAASTSVQNQVGSQFPIPFNSLPHAFPPPVSVSSMAYQPHTLNTSTPYNMVQNQFERSPANPRVTPMQPNDNNSGQLSELRKNAINNQNTAALSAVAAHNLAKAENPVLQSNLDIRNKPSQSIEPHPMNCLPNTGFKSQQEPNRTDSPESEPDSEGQDVDRPTIDNKPNVNQQLTGVNELAMMNQSAPSQLLVDRFMQARAQCSSGLYPATTYPCSPYCDPTQLQYVDAYYYRCFRCQYFFPYDMRHFGRKTRQTYSRWQTRLLESEFKKSKYVTRKQRLDLQYPARLHERQIKIWFQNRRMKEKKMNQGKLEDATSTTTAQSTKIPYGNDNATQISECSSSTIPKVENDVKDLTVHQYQQDQLQQQALNSAGVYSGPQQSEPCCQQTDPQALYQAYPNIIEPNPQITHEAQLMVSPQNQPNAFPSAFNANPAQQIPCPSHSNNVMNPGQSSVDIKPSSTTVPATWQNMYGISGNYAQYYQQQLHQNYQTAAMVQPPHMSNLCAGFGQVQQQFQLQQQQSYFPDYMSHALSSYNQAAVLLPNNGAIPVGQK